MPTIFAIANGVTLVTAAVCAQQGWPCSGLRAIFKPCFLGDDMIDIWETRIGTKARLSNLSPQQWIVFASSCVKHSWQTLNEMLDPASDALISAAIDRGIAVVCKSENTNLFSLMETLKEIESIDESNDMPDSSPILEILIALEALLNALLNPTIVASKCIDAVFSSCQAIYAAEVDLLRRAGNRWIPMSQDAFVDKSPRIQQELAIQNSILERVKSGQITPRPV